VLIVFDPFVVFDEEEEEEEEESDDLLLFFSIVEKARRTISASSEIATLTGCPKAGRGVELGAIEQSASVVGETNGGGGEVSMGPEESDLAVPSVIASRLLRSIKELAP